MQRGIQSGSWLAYSRKPVGERSEKEARRCSRRFDLSATAAAQSVGEDIIDIIGPTFTYQKLRLVQQLIRDVCLMSKPVISTVVG